jgi:tetratricopeptide (TPR) repeat protein
MLEEHYVGTRYRTLETIGDYAREKLEQSGELAQVAASHCMYYFAMAKAANRGTHGPEQADWVWRIEAELDNVRSSMTLALAGGVDPVIAVKIAVAMQGFWILRGYSTEGRNLVRASLALPAVQASDLAHAWALYVGAALAESQSDYAEALKMLETCLVLRRRLGNLVDIAATLSTLSQAQLHVGDAEGAEMGEREAFQIFLQLGDRVGEAIGLQHLGTMHLEQCMSIAREVGNQEIEGECEVMLGEAAFEAGDRTQACLRFKRSLTVCREAGDKRGEASALWWLGKADLQFGDIASARSRLGEALLTFRDFGMRGEMLGCLEDHAALLHAEGATDAAVHVAAAVSTSRERLDLARPPRNKRRWQAQVDALRRATSTTAFDAAWLEGREWQVDQAVRRATSYQCAPIEVSTT